MNEYEAAILLLTVTNGNAKDDIWRIQECTAIENLQTLTKYFEVPIQRNTTCKVNGDWAVLPFKVGDLAEAISFRVGFHGAWFRCKIESIYVRKVKGPQYKLDYYDYLDDKPIWTLLYQKPPGNSYPTLILRPPYPRIYNENNVPDANAISELIVVHDGVWRVGDKVDGFIDSGFWSGTVTKILEEDKVEIELPPPPAGEGSTYDVLCANLHPSLDWSVEHGWSVAMCSARLILPVE